MPGSSSRARPREISFARPLRAAPRPFGSLLVNCAVMTANEKSWTELTNGELLDAAEAGGVDILITSDKNLRYQQILSTRRIAVIELPTNRLRLVVKYAPQINTLLLTIQPGAYEVVAP